MTHAKRACSMLLFLAVLGLAMASGSAPAPLQRAVGATRTHRPMAFIENQGQWDPHARFMARKRGLTAWLEDRSVLLELVASQSTARLRMVFEGAYVPAFEAKGDQETRYSFMLGNDRATWRSNVRGFSEVACRGLYPGIDLGFREGKQGLEYDLYLSPEADLSRVVVSCEGSRSLSVDAGGDLCVETPLGVVRQPPVVAWYSGPGGKKVPAACAYRVLEGNRYGFEVPERLPGLAMVIDPGIVWSTYVGGLDNDDARSLRLGPSGNLIFAGDTSSMSYPASTMMGVFDATYNANTDLHVSVLSPDGVTLLYATYLGGSQLDFQPFIDVNAGGTVAIAAMTLSSDFPKTTQAMLGLFTDVTVTLLNPDATVPPGQQLVFSTFLGDIPMMPGGGGDTPLDIRFAGPNLLIAGTTSSRTFPTTLNAYDTMYGGSTDAFVTILDPVANRLVYSTFLGQGGGDLASSAVLDPQTGQITVVGTTEGPFPTAPNVAPFSPYDATHNGLRDLFIARLDPSLPTAQQLVYSTFVGGSADEGGRLALDAFGNAVVCGSTSSMDFPRTTGAYDETPNGGSDCFVLRLNLAGGGTSDLLYSTLLGGGGDEFPTQLALDASGTVTLVGRTLSPGFPTTPWAFQPAPNGSDEGFVARIRLDPNHPGDQLLYSSFLGGSGADLAQSVVLARNPDAGGAFVSSRTSSLDFPTAPMMPPPYDNSYNGVLDAAVTLFDMLPTSISKYGRPSGALSTMSVGAYRLPGRGQTFYVTVDGATPNAPVALALATRPDTAGTFRPNFGVTLFVDPTSIPLPAGRIRATTDATGHAVFPVRIPPGAPLGRAFYGQVFLMPNARPLGGATAALAITVLP